LIYAIDRNSATKGKLMVDATRTITRSENGELDLARLLERLTEQLLSGETVDLDALVTEHPEHAERLAELLPTIRAVAEVGRAANPLESKLRLASALPLRAPAEGRSGEGGVRGSGEHREANTHTLGDFRILREIGRGGMGVVYEAEQLSLGRRVALKVLPFASMLDERQLQRFKNEARAAATLHHPNIVPVFSVGCERGVHFYAMQYVEGQTLAAVIDALRVQGSGFGVQDAKYEVPAAAGRLRTKDEASRSDASQRSEDNVAGTLRVPPPHTECVV
jgi:hypothetical protein